MRTEGRASILQSGNDVFYNPAQVINRDMSLSGAWRGGARCDMRSPEVECAFSLCCAICELQCSAMLQQHLLYCNDALCNATLHASAVIKYFIEQREAEIASGAARKAHNKAANAGAASGSGGPPQAGQGIRVLEGLAASGLRAIRCAIRPPPSAAAALSHACSAVQCSATGGDG